MANHKLEDVFEALEKMFVRAGANEDNARDAANAILTAEAEDNAICGFFYAPILRDQLASGRIDGEAEPEIAASKGAAITIDAKNGLAQSAFALAVAELPSIAKKQGIALATIVNSTNALALGPFARLLADEGCLSMIFVNSPACVAPEGATRPLFGTNPFAFAVPIDGEAPLVIDQSTSAVAKTEVMKRAEAGEAIPLGWAVDGEGKPTTDPKTALDEGAIVPSGGIRGANVALMVEIMASCLSGMAGSVDAGDLEPDRGPPIQLGHSVIAIPLESAAQQGRLRRLLDLIAAEASLRVPGRRRADALVRARRDGIAVEPEVAAMLGL